MTLQHVIRINGSIQEVKRVNRQSIELWNDDTLWPVWPFKDVAKVVYRNRGRFVSEIVILD